MKRFLFLIIGVSTLIGCAAARELDERFKKPRSFVGDTETVITGALGEPVYSRIAADGDKVIYYRQRWYLIRDGKAQAGEYFSRQSFMITVNSLFDSDYKDKIKGRSFVIQPIVKEAKADLDFKRSQKALAHVMTLAGLVSAKEAAKADYTVLLGQSEDTSKEGQVKRTLLVQIAPRGKEKSDDKIWSYTAEAGAESAGELEGVWGVLFSSMQGWTFSNSNGKVTYEIPMNDPMTRGAFGQ